ncbi:Holliday junction ATP-dependent DNA helicase RuvA [Sedimentisphaera cyanobacteriorum]|uniref:Holliday junction branch migration complex subunit RuvA n=1 Tax=Sedimentisphaera cyanobacteriorum TaxID=1940790 RepID=A0A1Q2HRN2_9BACT|nr:Holliday junction branch migration protein RuvA [Sedimentisphaera cyanobacteriorum]AQQ10119.1 Holliday junction ATP-dependent DNA helicase RuvA [Sedimentisphaera cyanobacteriorum]
MIARISGNLLEVSEDSALVEVGDIAYQVLLPGYCISTLSGQTGSRVTLYTSQYFEGTPGGGNMIPRIIGFMSEKEKQFFNIYTSVKGMGIKKGLKSLSMPVETIACAIENGDEKIVVSLPGIGKRLAQHIIAELSGKLDYYALSQMPKDGGGASAGGFKAFQLEALEILTAWGEKRAEVTELIMLAQKKHPEISTAEELVPAVYRLKQGAEA